MNLCFRSGSGGAAKRMILRCSGLVLFFFVSILIVDTCHATGVSGGVVHSGGDAEMPYVPLYVSSGDQRHRFDVQIADTPERQAIGLMFRRELAPSRGMLFDFSPGRVVRMWMKNTLVPLDMVFTDRGGHILWIEDMARPGSLVPRGPSVPVFAVLELAGGTCSRLGIRVGDKLSHDLFKAAPVHPEASVREN